MLTSSDICGAKYYLIVRDVQVCVLTKSRRQDVVLFFLMMHVHLSTDQITWTNVLIYFSEQNIVTAGKGFPPKHIQYMLRGFL
jgi:hypothetical protein